MDDMRKNVEERYNEYLNKKELNFSCIIYHAFIGKMTQLK